jgi:GT2 family glycosyltransferase
VQREAHELAQNTHQNSRRYYFSDQLVLKQYLLEHPRGSFNQSEWSRESEFLKAPPQGFDAARLVCTERNHAEAWTLMERLPGKTLLKHKLEGYEFDHGAGMVKLLDQLVALEAVGLSHQDVRIWNVLMDERDQMRLIDYGSIGRSSAEPVWPFNIHLSFVLFVHEWMAAEVDVPQPFRTVAFSPGDLPAPFDMWIRSLWDLPMTDWSFMEIRDRLVKAQSGDEAMSKLPAMPREAWAHAVEHAVQVLKVHRNHFDRRMLDIEERQASHSEHIRLLGERATMEADRLHVQIRVIEAGQRQTSLLEHQVAELHQLAVLLSESQAQNALMLNSRSWRWTAPMRWAILQAGLLKQHGLRQRLVALLRKAGLIATPASAPDAVPASALPGSAPDAGCPEPRHPGTDAERVLGDPALAALVRPAAASRPAPSAVQDQVGSEHEPLLHLSVLQDAPASVAVILLAGLSDQAAIRRSVQSLLRQTDPAWELVLLVGEDRAHLVDEWLDADWRIRRFVSRQGAELESLKQAMALATAFFVGVLEAGDTLDDELVSAFNQAALRADDVDMLYSDESWQPDDAAAPSVEVRKPGWSPEQQMCVDMLGHFCAIRKSVALACDPWPSQHSSVVLYGLNLEAATRARRIIHVAEVLYERRVTAAAGRSGGFFPARAWNDLVQGMRAHLLRSGRSANVHVNERIGSLLVMPSAPAPVNVTVVILTAMKVRDVPGRGEILLAENMVRSIIEKTDHPGYQILLVDDGATPPALKKLLQDHGHRVVSHESDGPFSFARKANFGSRLAEDGVVVLLNDDMEVVSTKWLQWMVAHATQPAVGVVGAKLRFPDDTIQHAGMVMGMHESCGHALHHLPDDEAEYLGLASIDRNCSAVTGAAMAYRTSVFESLGGFDETFRVDYNDIDFCLRCIESGLRVVLASQAVLYHFHNSSFERPHDDATERALFKARWGSLLKSDPFFPPGLIEQSLAAQTPELMKHGSTA